MKKVTVATVLQKNRNKVYAVMNTGNLKKTTDVIEEILMSNKESLHVPADADRCVQTLRKLQNRPSQWASTYVTWESAMKVIR